MNPLHEAKVDELIEVITKELKTICQRLYKSGGVDVESYSTEHYFLAKVLVTAAMEQCKDKFYPQPDNFRKDFKNLLHF